MSSAGRCSYSRERGTDCDGPDGLCPAADSFGADSLGSGTEKAEGCSG